MAQAKRGRRCDDATDSTRSGKRVHEELRYAKFPCKGAQEQNQNVMCSDEGVGLFSVRYACVAHFYVDLPSGDENVPSTPKFSTVEYDLPASDHGKEKAQQRWIALMQMTPTRLVF